jgi:23S rRNA (cytidine1920-2'-O)/16S rRNA (cytidine1409-2'-O)-methyltransferase
VPRQDRERIDVLLVERGLAETRAKAQALVLSGDVSSAGTRIDKPGQRIPREAEVCVKPGRRWVGRGAEKIGPALDAFGLDPSGLRILDVGASTGGFTQLVLERGAAEVLALDVGRGQLDWILRSDPRVRPLEGINARHLTSDMLPAVPDWAVIDVSFISLELVLPPVAACLAREGTIVALVKPQFEVGKGQVGKGGIVRDRDLHREVLGRLVEFVSARDWTCRGICPAGLQGAMGNQEYFIQVACRTTTQAVDPAAWIDAAVRTENPS